MRFLHGLGAISMLLSATLLTARAGAAPVVLDFDTLPPPPWDTYSCDGLDEMSVSGGVLTIDSPSCAQWSLPGEAGAWHQQVDNAKGWAIETRVRIDPASAPHPGSTIMLWINDHTNMLIVGLTQKDIRLEYPEFVGTPLDTTDDFHVYRVVSKLDQVRIYVDGILKIDHTLSTSGAGTDALSFGDGDGAGYSRSYWDYFWYDVGCGPSGCDPGSTCVEGAACDDGDACTTGDVCAKGVCMGIPLSCPALDECHAPGACVNGSGCTAPPVPDGTPCSGGVCAGGVCKGGASATSSSVSSSSGGTGGEGGAGGSMGSGGAGSTDVSDFRIYGRSCLCAMGGDRDHRPAWVLAALIALWQTRARSRRARV